jgi:hypothetical protein
MALASKPSKAVCVGVVASLCGKTATHGWSGTSWFWAKDTPCQPIKPQNSQAECSAVSQRRWHTTVDTRGKISLSCLTYRIFFKKVIFAPYEL